MTVSQLQVLRCPDYGIRPDPTFLLPGQPAVNTHPDEFGLFFRDNSESLVKIGPCFVNATEPPNSDPPSPGVVGNSLGEFWYDTQNNRLRVWDGSEWSSFSSIEVGEGLEINVPETERSVLIDSLSSTFSSQNHGLSERSSLHFEATSGSLPDPLNDTTTYYVVSSALSLNEFQVSETPGGSPVALTEVASGTFVFKRKVLNTDGILYLSDTGVAPGSYTNANITVDEKGRITFAESGGVEITIGDGLDTDAPGGVITNSGTISLSDTTVTPGSYTNANITIDQKGRITAATNGSGGGGGGGGGTVTLVGLSAPTGFSVTGSPVTSTGFLTLEFSTGYSLPTLESQGNWDEAFADRYKWDGSSNGLNPAVGRASLELGSAATTSSSDYVSASSVQPANVFLAGPEVGGPVPPTFRALSAQDLPSSPVTEGSYTNASITVDSRGRVTSATSGSPSGVSSVTGTAPISSSGGSTPAISISAATTSAAGSMSASDKTKLDGIEAGAQVNAPTNLGYTASSRELTSSTGTDVTLPLVSSTEAGLAPASGGGTSNFLRADGTWTSPGGGGTVSSVGVSMPTGFSVSNSPITSSGSISISFASGYSLPTTTSQGNWDTAYTDRLKWDGGSSGLDAATGRTSLGLGTAATQASTAFASSGATTSSGLTMSTNRVLGRITTGTGAIEELTPGTGVTLESGEVRIAAEIGLACSDETTSLTTGAAKVTFRMPYAMTLSSVRANVNTAPTGSALIVDINENGVSIFSTKLQIDSGSKTSTTSGTPAVLSDTSLANDSEITVDIDQIGATIAGIGLKIWLIGRRT